MNDMWKSKTYLSILFVLLLSFASFADEVPEGEIVIDEVIENVDFESTPEPGEQSFTDTEQSDPAGNEDNQIEISQNQEAPFEEVQESEVEIVYDEVTSEISSSEENTAQALSDPAEDQEILASQDEIIMPDGIIDRDDNNALYVGEESGDLQSKIDLFEDTLNTEKVEVFADTYVGSDDVTDWDIADYFKAVVTQALFDIFGEPEEDELEEEEEYEVLVANDSYDADYIKGMKNSLDAEIRQLALNREGNYKNVVIYHGQFNGYDCDLIIPYEDYKNLIVRDQYLINVGKSAVTGRILYEGDSLDATTYETYVYILNPIYGNTSNVWQYGNFNYRRHYFLSSTGSYERITSQDMYGGFYVSDVDVYYSSTERVYVCLLVIIILMGVNIIWKRL